MPMMTLRKYRVQATLVNTKGKKSDINFLLDATNGAQVWDALTDMADDANEDIISARVLEIKDDGSESPLTTVTPFKKEEKKEEPPKNEGWRWWENEAFELVSLPTKKIEHYD